MMKEKAPPAPSSSPSTEPPAEERKDGVRVTPGLATLLRGTAPKPAEEVKTQVEPKPNGAPAQSERSVTKHRAVRISLVVADLLLLALAARLVSAKGHIGFVEVALCVVALGLGAWLTCLAIWKD